MKVVAFDFDGTLADTADLWDEIKSAAAADLGLTLTEGQNRALYFKWDQEYIGWGGNMSEQMRIYKDSFSPKVEDKWKDRGWIRRIKLFPRIKETVEAVSGSYKPIVVTSRDSNTVVEALDNCGVLKYFKYIVAAENGLKYADKPSTRMMEEVLEIESGGTRPSDIVMIDDTPGGILMGRNAGAKTIGIGYGGFCPAEALARHRPDYLLSSTAEIPMLPDIIGKVFGGR
jgi:phosphoglycolate phosphatase-like HAD superfamily hydrolase